MKDFELSLQSGKTMNQAERRVESYLDALNPRQVIRGLERPLSSNTLHQQKNESFLWSRSFFLNVIVKKQHTE